MKKIILSAFFLLASSGLAFAQAPVSGNGRVTDLRSLISFIEDYINVAIELIIAIAVVVFVYNVVRYFVVNTEGDRSEAGKYLLYSVLGLAAVISFWGLVNVVTKTFGLDNGKPNVQNLYFK